ncbi:hypothetical protein FACS189442_4550 [Spirochaetia bacterium]|nr:hypothetical protein FACS189442_4550 [Spirochaetia bacterium]
MTQAEFDAKLNEDFHIDVEIAAIAPLSPTNINYNCISDIQDTGFTFKPRELLHVMGCKLASLPYNETDKCINAAQLYSDILDFQTDDLCFVDRDFESDFLTNRSNELGVAFTCLFAQKYYNIPTDQLGQIKKTTGSRFDYRGTNGTIECIFEAKGTTSKHTQKTQIESGIDKKIAHHLRDERFDVELIVSTNIRKHGGKPKMIIGDPDYSSLKKLFEKYNDRFFRLRHYSRLFQFIGMPNISYHLNKYALRYINSERKAYMNIFDKDTMLKNLNTINVSGERFYGNWFNEVYPEGSQRYIRYKNYKPMNSEIKVFQGLREFEFMQLFYREPFTHELINKNGLKKFENYNNIDVSVMDDGSIQVFKIDPDVAKFA